METLSPALISLLPEGLSFVPGPTSYNWFQLQKDFDTFQNQIRALYLFREENNSYMPNPVGPLIKQVSKWRSTKTNSPDLEIFLASVKKAFIPKHPNS